MRKRIIGELIKEWEALREIRRRLGRAFGMRLHKNITEYPGGKYVLLSNAFHAHERKRRA